MALSQKLEFRQTQSLVMTPQLMQAIKLLQLSNLDLVAFVDEELERNPLLERAAEGEGPDAAPQEPAAPADDPAGQVEAAGGDAEPGQFEPGVGEWMDSDLGSRAEIEQRLDTGLDNVFPEEPADAAARAAQEAGGADDDDPDHETGEAGAGSHAAASAAPEAPAGVPR